jgi:hypothetical protein
LLHAAWRWRHPMAIARWQTAAWRDNYSPRIWYIGDAEHAVEVSNMTPRIRLLSAVAAAAITLTAFAGTGLAQPTARWVAVRAAQSTGLDGDTIRELFGDFYECLSAEIDVPVAELREAERDSRSGERSMSGALDMDSSELEDAIRGCADEAIDQASLSDAQARIVEAYVDMRLDQGL